ncbi:MAG: hypothetical protein CL573_05490 [Alphaproteobacteria bacterium]|nr:hypothetical protein [Alphaproteobacteria bacterium]HCP00615.1 hypothetical protein [Rhodospirillaceae bacterium]
MNEGAGDSLLKSNGGFDLIIDCEKCVLRPLNRERASKNYCDWLNDDIVNKFSRRLGKKHTSDDVWNYIDAANTSTDILLLGIFDRITGIHIGNIQLKLYDPANGLADLSTLIGERDFWGRGFAKDVWKYLVHFGFNTIGVRKFTMGNSAGNKAASGKTLYVGAKLESTKRQHILIGGKYQDVLEYGLFAEEFYAKFPDLAGKVAAPTE